MKYDIEYYENLLRIQSNTAEKINKIRWNFILEVLSPNNILDYGSGCGFFRAYRPSGIEVDSYDIGPYPQTGIRIKLYDVVCFWDVFEHINDFKVIEPILALSSAVALSIPIKPDNKHFADWKHFKIGEHLHFWNEDTLQAFFLKYGFNKVKNSGYPECPPREDILSIILTK